MPNSVASTYTSGNTSSKRVKVTLACTVCRKKKVKCDGVQPACHRCLSLGYACQYSDPPKKRGPPKMQVEIISNRAHRIESLLVVHHHQSSAAAAAVPSSSSPSSSSPPAQGANHPHHHQQQLPLYQQQATTTPKGALSAPSSSLPSPVPSPHPMNKMFYYDHEFIDENEAPNQNALMCMITDAVAMTNATRSSVLVSPSMGTPGSHNIRDDFFTQVPLGVGASDIKPCLLSYFDHVNVFFPLLSKPHFMQQWHTQKVDALLCYAVAAMGARCINHDNNDEPHDQMYFDQCQWLLEQGAARDHASQLSSVQALVLLCWYAHLRGQMQACASMRHRLGQACDKLGLDRDPEPSVGLVCMEMHRRAYWMVFITDQWLGWSLTQCGLASGAANGIAAANVAWPQLEDQQLYLIDRPARDHATPIVDQNVDHNHAARDLSTTTAEHALQINTFAQLIKLSTLVREITQLARHRPYDTHDPLPWHAYQQQHNALEKQLTEWLLQLPSYLEFGKPADDRPVSPMATVYHMLYYAVQLMLYEPLTANTHDDAVAPAIESTRTKARNICTNASNTILHLAEQMLQNGQKAYFGNIFMITLSLASSVYLHERVHHGPQRIAFDGINDASIAPQERADLYAHAVLKAVALISHYLPAAVDLPQRVHSYFSIHTPSMDGKGAASAPTSPSTRSTSNNRSKKRRYSDCSSSIVSENASIHGNVVPRPFAMPDDLCSGDDDLLDVGLDALLSETTPLSSPSTSCHSNDASFSSLTMAWMEDTDLWAFMNSQPSPVTPHPGPSSHVTPYPTLSSPSSASSTSMAFVSHFDQPIQQPLTPPDAHHTLLVPPVPPCTTMDALYHIQSPVWKSQDNATDLIDPYTYMPVIHC